MSWLVAFGGFGFLQPGNGLVQVSPLHQIDSYVIIRISKFRIHLNGPLAIFHGFLQVTQKRDGPSPIGVSFSRRVNSQAFTKTVYSRLKTTLRQMLNASFP